MRSTTAADHPEAANWQRFHERAPTIPAPLDPATVHLTGDERATALDALDEFEALDTAAFPFGDHLRQIVGDLRRKLWGGRDR